jgi:hypothetical protein
MVKPIQFKVRAAARMRAGRRYLGTRLIQLNIDPNASMDAGAAQRTPRMNVLRKSRKTSSHS